MLARSLLVWLGAALIMTTGCQAGPEVSQMPHYAALVAGDGPGERALIGPEITDLSRLPKSRYGNPVSYTELGREYKVLQSAEGFVERGLASWYGSKFHGRRTSSGEPYDMYQMTAAHKQLPLPSFARVTRVDSGRSIIVKVNDRGPFVEGRVIDLSFAAAVRLDMLSAGTAEVTVEVLSTPYVEPNTLTQRERFVQVGSFQQLENARNTRTRVSAAIDLPVLVHSTSKTKPFVHRVVVGPLDDVDLEPVVIRQLANAGFSGSFAITGLQ